MPFKLLVAEDHEVVRLGLRVLLQDSEFRIVGETDSGAELRRLVDKLKADLVLLDLRLADGESLDTLARIKQAHPDLPVLVFSNYDNPSFVAEALAKGAAGYLLKDVNRERLFEAMRAAAANEDALGREDRRRITGALATPRMAAELEAPLTKRESEVLRQMALGQTNKEIAEALGISYETVKEHVQHILRKLGVSDRTQAAVFSVRKGLV